MRYFLCFMVVLCAVTTLAQNTFDDRALKYVSAYYTLAMAEQQRTGVPASVTLAQGIVETDAGTSELMTKANNHFGVKCKNDWKGETFIHTDDLPDECFKKYKCAEDSYKDHSDHLLRNPRYASLFKIPVTDYSAWAKGLKTCGYATCSTYAEKLIKAVEDYHLQQYTLAALDGKSITPPGVDSSGEPENVVKELPRAQEKTELSTQPPAGMDKPNQPADLVKPDENIVVTHKEENKDQPLFSKPMLYASADKYMVGDGDTVIPGKHKPTPEEIKEEAKYERGKLITANGLKAFYALKGESLLPYAVEYNMRYAHLLEINDLTDAPLSCNMLIYIEKKLQTGTREKHVVKEYENLRQIAQKEGIQLKKLMMFNMLDEGEEPAAGVSLELQFQATHKPSLRNIVPEPVQNESLAGMSTPGSNASDFIATNKSQAPDTMTESKSTPSTNNYSGVANAHQPQKESAGAGKTNAMKESDPDFEYHADAYKKTNGNKKPEDLNGIKADMDKIVYAKDSGIHINSHFSQDEPGKPRKPASVPAAKYSKFYTVHKGDSLYTIAKRNNVSMKQLMKWNPMSNPAALHLGQKIQVRE